MEVIGIAGGPDSLRHPAAFPRLQHLQAGYFEWGTAAAAWLAQLALLPRLQRLDLGLHSPSDTIEVTLPPFPCLTSLSLDTDFITWGIPDAHLAVRLALPSMPLLESLSAAGELDCELLTAPGAAAWDSVAPNSAGARPAPSWLRDFYMHTACIAADFGHLTALTFLHLAGLGRKDAVPGAASIA